MLPQKSILREDSQSPSCSHELVNAFAQFEVVRSKLALTAAVLRTSSGRGSAPSGHFRAGHSPEKECSTPSKLSSCHVEHPVWRGRITHAGSPSKLMSSPACTGRRPGKTKAHGRRLPESPGRLAPGVPMTRHARSRRGSVVQSEGSASAADSPAKGLHKGSKKGLPSSGVHEEAATHDLSPEKPVQPSAIPRAVKAVKASVREGTPKRAALHDRKHQTSHNSSICSPSLKANRTAVVSPAPSHPRVSCGTPNRFGFQNVDHLKNGDSSESVNSILSDVVTPTHSSTNLLECDQLTRKCVNGKSEELTSNVSDTHSVSIASSGVTTAINACLTAHTKHLPKPQTATIKIVPSKTVSSNQDSVKPSRPFSSVSYRQSSSGGANDTRLSTTSVKTNDSGVGSSSSDSDRLQGAESGKLQNLNSLHGDLSDKWLEERKAESISPRKPLHKDIVLDGRGSFYLRTSSKEEPRDPTITYGMARQKFAPYSRNRYGFATQPTTKPKYSTATVPSEATISGVTKIPGSVSLVKKRVAQLEKTPPNSRVQQNSLRRNSPKKLNAAKPTSLQKTPVLVTSPSQKTIQLSKPVFRKLEYSEGKNTSSISPKHSKLDRTRKTQLKVVEDILVVSSVESQKCSEESSNREGCQKNTFETPVKQEETHKRVACSANSPAKSITELNARNSVKSRKCNPCRNSCNLSDEQKLKLHKADDIFIHPDGQKDENLVSAFTKITIKDSKPKSPMPSRSMCTSRRSPAHRKPLKSDRTSESSEDGGTPKLSLRRLSITKQNSVEDGAADGLEANSLTKPLLETSMESLKSFGGSAMHDSTSTVSGKCSPTLGSARGDMDHDFLIDDEIADQPGLIFDDDDVLELGTSLFSDDDLFEKECEKNLPPSPLQSSPTAKIDDVLRSRSESLSGASSLGADDLMLDYDFDDPVSMDLSPVNRSFTDEHDTNFKPSLRISIPGPRYEEEVLSPSACDIYDEWTTVLAEVHGDTPSAIRCIAPHENASSGTGTPLSGSQSKHSGSRPSSGIDFSSNATIDVKKPPLLKPPRQACIGEGDGSGITMDRISYNYLCQDITAMKTLLLKLKRVLQQTDTINPFDSNIKNSLYLNLACSDPPNGSEGDGVPGDTDLSPETADLKRQVVLLQQELLERDRTIRLLQQQLSQALNSSLNGSVHSKEVASTTSHACNGFGPDKTTENGGMPPEEILVNAATQTDRMAKSYGSISCSGFTRGESIDDGRGPTISFEADAEHWNGSLHNGHVSLSNS